MHIRSALLFIAFVGGAISAPAVAQTANPLRPYVGVVGGSEHYDGDGPRGDMVGLIGGVDYDLGETAVFVGAEANAMKGFGDIDKEYGIAGTIGTRAYVGGAWKLFAKVGVQRVDFDRGGGQTRLLTGLGADYAPFATRPGLAFRFAADTFEFETTRLTAGVVLRFNSF
jgi:hypothetical protein